MLHIVIATKFFFKSYFANKNANDCVWVFLRCLLGRAMMILLSKSIKIESKL